MPQPLAGIKVADFSHVMAGPFCTHFLRMLGADVIKVEPPKGDAMRTYGPFREHDGLAPAFIAANVGKRSLAVDIKSAEGAEIVRRLIAECDVLVENFRPGVMGRLGFDYEACRKLNARLIYCAVSGYGQSGAKRDRPAIDNIVQATSGIMASNGNPEDPPSRVGWPVVDTYTGTLAALAVLAALTQRERFGQGQYVDISMLDASVVLLTSLATPFLVTGQLLPRTGDVGYSGSPTSAVFLTSDGSRLSLGVVQDNHFRLLCAAVGRPDLIEDPRFRDPVARSDSSNAQALRLILDEIFRTRAGLEWEERLCAMGVPCGLVRDIGAVCDEVRGEGRGLISPTIARRSATPQAAAFVNAGFVFAHDGPGVDAPAPLLGEHSRAILQSLGYSDSQITHLISRRVVVTQREAAAEAQG